MNLNITNRHPSARGAATGNPVFHLPLTLLISVAISGSASAAPIEMVFAESTYQPGSQISFSVILPTGITDLGAYEIQIELTGNMAEAGIDYGFDLGATDAANSNYVFDADDLFFDTVITATPISQLLTLSDLTLGPGVDVIEDINVQVANVIVFTSENYRGPLSFRIDAQALILDTPAAEPVAQYASIQTATLGGSPTIILVPEPGGIALFVLFAFVGIFNRCRNTFFQ